MSRNTRHVVFLLSIASVTGLFLANDYGLSWDEHLHRVYAEQTIEMYLGRRTPGDAITDLRFYGPAFSVPWMLLSNLLTKLIPNFRSADAGHLVYWLAFIPAPLILYVLARRHVHGTAALAGTLLFATQPLIFGHAFVNPKDTPFMTAFLGSVWLGLGASDLLVRGESTPSLSSLLRESRASVSRMLAGWSLAAPGVRVLLGALWITLIVVALDFLVTHAAFSRVTWMLQQAYEGRAVGLVQRLFSRVAQDAWKTPLSAYMQKASTLYLWSRFPFLAAALLATIALSSRALGVPVSLRWYGRIRTYWRWGIAAVALGLTGAIRVFGPFAGLLVTADAHHRLKRKAWPHLGAYWLLSGITLYTAWPFLWRSPLRHLYEAVFRMSRFPWQGRVLYEGQAYSVTELAWHFVPRMLLFQLTIPAIVLGGLGLLVTLRTMARTRRLPFGEGMILVWFGLPVAVVLMFDVQIYNPFRQLMFVLPALFFLACIGVEKLIGLVRGNAWAMLVITGALAPGLWAIVQLHPYEIVYYNELVGGVAGAYGRFGLEHWGTTFREAIEYVNGVALPDARVYVSTGEVHTMTPFARADLQFSRLTSEVRLQRPRGAYAIEGDSATGDASQAGVIYTVEAGGVPLTFVVKY
jgi:hypothetical protein